MRFGAMNFPIRSVVDEIHALGSLGFDYLELAMDPPEAHYRLLMSQRDALQAVLDRYGMGLICHLPTFIHTADLTASIRDASREELLNSLAAARDLGAQKVVLHPSFVGGMGRSAPDLPRSWHTGMPFRRLMRPPVKDRTSGAGYVWKTSSRV